MLIRIFLVGFGGLVTCGAKGGSGLRETSNYERMSGVKSTVPVPLHIPIAFSSHL